MDWEFQGKPATDDQIVAFEKTLAVRLPVDYRTFLKTTNGAVSNSLLCKVTWAERILKSTLAIGMDSTANIFLLVLNGENSGFIIFWARDYEVDFEAGVVPDFSNVGMIAPSFSAFLKGLVVRTAT